MTSSLQLTVHRTGGRLVIEVAGEWDISDDGRFELAAQQALRGEQQLVVIDLSRLESIASIGLHACAGLAAASRHAPWDIAFVRGAPTVQRAFAVVGLGARLRFVDRLDDAV